MITVWSWLNLWKRNLLTINKLLKWSMNFEIICQVLEQIDLLAHLWPQSPGPQLMAPPILHWQHQALWPQQMAMEVPMTILVRLPHLPILPWKPTNASLEAASQVSIISIGSVVLQVILRSQVTTVMINYSNSSNNSNYHHLLVVCLLQSCQEENVSNPLQKKTKGTWCSLFN